MAKKKGDKDKTPESYMRSLVPSGDRIDHDKTEEPEVLEPSDMYIDPVDFCQAVINGDWLTLGQVGIRKPPSLSQRLEAARIVIPYTNKKKPVDINNKHEHSWGDVMREADARLEKRMEVDIETGKPIIVN